MQVADQLCHRVLTYIVGLQRHGYTPTVADVNAYAARANRQNTGRRLFNTPTYPLVVKRESVLVWMHRLGWLDLHGPTSTIDDDDLVVVTALGKAALAMLDDAETTSEKGPVTISLDKEDPLALAKVVGSFMEKGQSALIDRFFGHEVFLPIAQRTEVERILTGPHPPARIAAIEQALADYSVDRNFEVRVDDEDQHHDRYLIPNEGSIWALGTSVNGVGARHATMIEIKDPVATEAIRANFETAWESGRTLNPAPKPDAELAVQKEEAPGNGHATAVDEEAAAQIEAEIESALEESDS